MKRTDEFVDIIAQSAAEVILTAKIEAYDKVLDVLINKSEMICKVMDTNEANNILYHSLGKRFNEIMNKRNELWAKRFLIQNLIGKVWEERILIKKEIRELKMKY